jgi:diaminopimelate epimerase
MSQIKFTKMHGAGNDFILLDNRAGTLPLLESLPIAALAHRQKGIGFDQLVWLEKAADADVFMRLANADGGEISACGNATRCVAKLLMDETGKSEVTIRTKAGLLRGKRTEDGGTVADMGIPQFEWQKIPLSKEVDTLNMPRLRADLPPAVAVSMGNPHAVMFIERVEYRDLGGIGAELEHHAMFPERANISLATISGQEDITLRVWERGTGLTLACGTAACATLVAAVCRGLIPGRFARIHLPGGVLPITWADDGHVWMGGPVAVAFSGQFRVEDYSN